MTPAQPQLAASGIVLRPWSASDAADLAVAIQEPEIVRWLGVELPYTRADADSFVASAARQWQDGRAAHFVIDRDGLAGYVAALGLDGSLDRVELVYWVGLEHRNQGVATVAVQRIVEWLRSIGTLQIELGMVAGNEASAAVAERAGFVLREVIEGGGRLDGRPADERIYELPISRSGDPAMFDSR